MNNLIKYAPLLLITILAGESRGWTHPETGWQVASGSHMCIFTNYNMYIDNEDIFYYLTIENENYIHPELPDYDIKEGIIKGLYCLEKQEKSKNIKVQLLASGSMLNEIYKASKILKNDEYNSILCLHIQKRILNINFH